MGIDIGTSGCRVSMFDREGGLQCTASSSYTCRTPGPGANEIDADVWWQGTLQCLRILAEKGADFRRIAGIGVDGISWSPVPMDAEGTPLAPVMTWLDQRSLPQIQRITAEVGEDRLFSLSGNPVQPSYCTGKLLWMREHYPMLQQRVATYLQCNSYIVYKLTGTLFGDHSQGYGYHFYDVENKRYDEDMLRALGLEEALFPPLAESSAVVGYVSDGASALTGLPGGIPVVAGGLDAACCTFGAGVCRPGATQEQGGQAGGMSVAVDKPLSHPKLILSPHVVPGLWLLQGGSVGGGGALRWFRDQLGAWETAHQTRTASAFELMSEEAAGVPAGSGGLLFLPYMSGERSPIWDANARGAFVGLSYDKTRAAMIRSVMEGTAYSLRHNLETAEEAGVHVERLYAVGGAANSTVWTQIKADITGLPITVPYSDQATPLGAAMLAGVGVGIYRDFADAVDAAVHEQREHIPNREVSRLYDRLYSTYKGLYPVLKDTFHELSEIGG